MGLKLVMMTLDQAVLAVIPVTIAAVVIAAHPLQAVLGQESARKQVLAAAAQLT